MTAKERLNQQISEFDQRISEAVSRILGREPPPPPVNREALAAQRAEAIRTRDRELPALIAAVPKATAESDQLWEDWLAAENRRGAAIMARNGRGHWHERQIHMLEVELAASADPAIAAFIADTYEQAQAVRGESPQSGAHMAHVVAQLAAITVAREAAQALLLEVGNVDVAARLDAIRAIPAPFAGHVPVAA